MKVARWIYRQLNFHSVQWLFVMHRIRWTTLPDGTRIRTRILNGAKR